jgi:hypothetical protein
MRVERRITITSVAGDVMIDFHEANGRHWDSMYHMWIDGEALITIKIIALISAWIEHDDFNFTHPLLTISEANR